MFKEFATSNHPWAIKFREFAKKAYGVDIAGPPLLPNENVVAWGRQKTGFAQVNVQQSTTSEVNGQKMSVQTENDKTIIKTANRTLTINGDELQYCAQGCHEYVLYGDGTIKEKREN